MYQGTTPAITFEIKGYDLTGATVFVSFKHGNDLLTKSNVSVSYAGNISTVVCELTQEETLAMKKGAVIVQIRFIYPDGQALATTKKAIEIEDVIYPAVISYGGGNT
jgi:hypothetical protein